MYGPLQPQIQTYWVYGHLPMLSLCCPPWLTCTYIYPYCLIACISAYHNFSALVHASACTHTFQPALIHSCWCAHTCSHSNLLHSVVCATPYVYVLHCAYCQHTIFSFNPSLCILASRFLLHPIPYSILLSLFSQCTHIYPFMACPKIPLYFY